MQNHSRLLRVVLAGIIGFSATPSAVHANATDATTLERVVATGISSGGWSWPGWPSYGSTAGGSDGWWGGASSGSGGQDSNYAPACDDLLSTTPSGCNVYSPPVLAVNGCTGSPDGLIVNGLPATSLGAIFRGACNTHDECYGSYLSDKSTCDANLGEDMITFAQQEIPAAQWAYYEPHVRLQAATYAIFLSTDFISLGKYKTAQIEGSCRAHAQLLADYACI